MNPIGAVVGLAEWQEFRRYFGGDPRGSAPFNQLKDHSPMAAPDFTQLLKTNLDTVKRPPTLAAGTYHGRISKYEFGESREKKTPYVQFHIQLLSAGADVAPDDMRDADGVPIDLAKRQMRRDFFLTAEAMYRLKEFIESCGISTSGRSLDTTIPELLNAPVLVGVTQTNSKDGSEIYNNVGTLKGDQS